MKKVNCTMCVKHHFDHYECSKCGQAFSTVWPTVGSNHINERKATYCGNCGHKFKRWKE